MTADGLVLSVSDAAWLLRRPVSTLTRWRDDASFPVEPFTWAVLQRIAADHKATVLDPEWLSVTPEDPKPSAWRVPGVERRAVGVDSGTGNGDTARLRAVVEELESNLADARANIDSLDLAVMAFRDNWRRDADRADRAQRNLAELRRPRGS